MTTFGHSLTGLALFAVSIPTGASGWRWFCWAVLFIALANIPDWPLPLWGHRQLAVSHSLWVNLALCAMAAVILNKWLPGGIKKRRILLTGTLAWLSHLGLDTLYGDLPGLAIYWPFSDRLASLPLPWLSTLPHVPPPFDARVLRILFFEFLTFAPMIVLAWGARKLWIEKGQP